MPELSGADSNAKCNGQYWFSGFAKRRFVLLANALKPQGLVRGRFVALDGLRGLAAVSVMALHLISVFLGTSIASYHVVDRAYRILSFTPLAGLWAGNQAVDIFFIISGFALHRMLLSRMDYLTYAMRRIVRLWIPYMVTIAFAVVAVLLFGSRLIPEQSAWMNSHLGATVSAPLILQHLVMLGVFDSFHLDFVVWSLVQEMRLSLLFPLIFFVVQKWPPALVLILSLGIQAAANHLKGSDISFAFMFDVQAYFVIGALLSAYAVPLKERYARANIYTKALLAIVALILYPNCVHHFFTFCTLVGGTIIVCFALFSAKAGAFLEGKLVQWLGKISYSLYLVHAVVILTLINWLYPRFSFIVIVAISVPLIFISATLLNKFVEQPSIALSRRLRARKPLPT